MKKTLMVLSFALCATFAFAQTNKIATPAKSGEVRAAKTVAEDVQVQKAGYTGSIFTKDDELMLCTFATEGAGYTTGAIGENEMVNGTLVPAHGQTAFHSTWHRMPSNDTNALDAFNPNSPWGSHNYPAAYDVWRNYICGYNGNTPFGSTTHDEGIMVMTMMDQISAWGGSGAVGNFDAYIAFTPFSTAQSPLVRVRLYQYYRCFNNDQCWIDYSTNGTTWYAVEINVRSIDVESNSSIRGWKTVTMPASIGNQANVFLRLRWSCTSSAGGAYGYFWFVDDVSVIEAPDNNLVMKSNQYFEGFYQTMPQDLEVPVVWIAEFSNEGQLTQTNLTGAVYAFSADNTTAMLVASKTIASVAPDPMTTRQLIIDPLGFYDSATTSVHGSTYNPYAYATGSIGYLPTGNTGAHYFYTDITTDSYQPHFYENETFDTVFYNVNWNTDDHPFGVWGRDHGVVALGSAVTYGAIRTEGNTTIVSDDPGTTQWNKAGYGVFVKYVTGDTVPIDANGNHWRVLGMEMVASTEPGYQSPGTRLSPILFMDVTDSTGALTGWRGISTGASTYVVKSSDVISNSVLSDSLERFTYELPGGYPVVRIMFPNQPELIPNFCYNAGYELEEESDFTVATTPYYFYNEEGVATRFSEEPGMEDYAVTLGVVGRWSTFIADPFDGYVRPLNSDTYPMIRLLIGPSYYIPKVSVSLECDNPDEGNFIDGNYNDLCGTVDSVPVGGSVTYIVMPVPGYDIDKIYRDGVEIEYEPQEDADGITYGYVTLENLQASCVLRCSFKPHVGFDPVANVSMRLMPNPATSNVNVVMKGVTGTVNMALIDMSGRVVTTSQFNAENGTNINVSNLAKGAYFVRITNNKFSKIEKLIVR